MAGKVRYGKACYVTAGQREERCGMAGRVRRVPERYGVRGKAWYGRYGGPGLGELRLGESWSDMAGMAVLGALCFGKLGFVMVWQAR